MATPLSDTDVAKTVRAAAERGGIDALLPLQADLLPGVLRGGNAVIIGAAGSGARTGLALAALSRLAEADAEPEAERGPIALILAPTREEAGRLALLWGMLGADAGIRALAPDPDDDVAAEVLVLTPTAAHDRVRRSALKLDGLEVVVVDGWDGIQALGQGDDLEALVGQFGEAQRLIRADAGSSELDEFAQRAARRPLRFPARMADPRSQRPTDGPLDGVAISLVEVADDDAADAVAAIARRGGGGVVAWCRTEARATRLADELTARGLPASADGAAARAGDADGAAIVSRDVPHDADTLAERHAAGGYLLVAPRGLAHVRSIARQAGAALEPLALPTSGRDPALESFRARIRRALDEEDLSAQLLVLEPLFAERPAAEVAAALAALLREKKPARTPEVAPRSGAPEPRPNAGAPAPQGGSSGEPTRLFVSIGKRDNVRAGDIVGAITGEAGVSGDQIGRIDIRDNFSVVEVDSGIARKVIEAMNGRTVRGRSLRVDFDRKESGGGPGQGDGPRRPPRRRTPGRT